MTLSNGGSFSPGNGQSMSVSESLAAGQYPEPWWFRLQCPVQPGTVA